MVEIRYGENYEKAELAGHSVSEARELFGGELGIPGKAKARLNGKKLNGSLEAETYLCDEDRLSFAESKGKGLILVGAMLLALATTGGMFAFGWINATNTLSAVAATQDFAAVSLNGSIPITWSPYGFFKGTISTGASGTPVFNIDTATSNYTGDLVVTVSLANGDSLAKCYRLLSLKLMMYDSTDNIVDINESGGGNAFDYVLLTLGNGSVDIFPGGTADAMTVRVKSGFYITHIFKSGNWDTPTKYQPELFAEVAQR